MKEITTIIGNGFALISESEVNELGYYSSTIKYLVNGKELEKTWDTKWKKIEYPINSFQKIETKNNITGYKVRQEYEHLNLKLEISSFEYENLIDTISIMYMQVSEEKTTISDLVEGVDYKLNIILEKCDLKFGTEFNWECYKDSSYPHQGKRMIRSEPNDFSYSIGVEYQGIDKIMFPSIVVRDNCKVKVSSKNLYDIVRIYIKENIDNNVSLITSDYDFCFSVKKRIKLLEPKEKIREILKSNNRSYKKQKFEKSTYTYAADVVVFEMTTKEKPYEKYPILPDLYADNLAEANEKITSLLKELIDYINEPVVLCECCKGTGLSKELAVVNNLEFFK